MKNVVIIVTVLLIVAAAAVKADLLDCDEKKLPTLKDIPIIGTKVASEEIISGEHEVRDFFKSIGCKIKEGAQKATEGAKKLGSDLKEGAKKLGEKAKDLGAEFKTKFNDFKDKLSKDSSEDITVSEKESLRESVEIINPDILKAEQQCGHGYIIDSFGHCRKLRK